MAFDADHQPTPPRLRPAGPVIRARDAEIWTEAEAALEETRAYAERMKIWVQAAYEQERRRGYAEGWEAGAAETSCLVAATAAKTERYARELERELPGLVLELLERILGSFDPGEVLSLAVTHAVGKLRTGSAISLRVSPARVDELRHRLADLTQGAGAPAVRVEADPGLAPGACLMQSEFGNVELGVEAQLKALRDGLARAWGIAEAGPGSPPMDAGADTAVESAEAGGDVSPAPPDGGSAPSQYRASQ